MKKSTSLNPEMAGSSSINESETKIIPTDPKKETIANIMSFARSYSVRKGKMINRMEFMLN